MAHAETREVAIYMRNGSLWVGRFLMSGGELDFGDDRSDAAHGLALLVGTGPTSSAHGVQARNSLASRTGKTASVPTATKGVERPRLAA